MIRIGPIWDADERLGTYIEIKVFGYLFRKEFIWTRHRFDEKVSKPWTKEKV